MAQMEVREPAFRSRSGSIKVLLPFPGRIFLYGPFIRLAKGRYRVSFRCRVRLASQRQHPVIGLEVIGQNRTSSPGVTIRPTNSQAVSRR